MNPFSHLKIAALSDVGKRRKNNEDAFGTFPESGIFCVADGMGGGDDGEIASAAVVRAVETAAAELKPGDSGGYAARDVGEVIGRNLSKASAWICDRARERRLNGCGSTFVGVAFDATAPEQALAVHAGDSRLYLLHGRSIIQITRDHSVAELMGEKDESKLNPMFRSMVVNGIGIRPKAEPEFTPFKVAAGDRVLACSDGLTRMVPDKKILAVCRAESDPEASARALVSAALEAGGADNVTVVLIEIGELPPAVPRLEPPTAPEPDQESAAGENATTNGGTTGSTGGTLPGASSIANMTVETPLGTVAPRPVAVPRRPRKLKWWIAAALLALAAIVACALAARSPRPADKTPSPPAPAEALAVARDNPSAEEISAVAEPTNPVPPVAAPTNAIAAPASEVAVTANAIALSTNAVDAVPVGRSATDPALTEFAEACADTSVRDFIRALRRLAPEDGLPQDFNAEAERFETSARQFARRRGAREAEAAAVDLKIILRNAEPVRANLEARKGVVFRCACSAWDAILKGDPAQASVWSACVRLVKILPTIRRQ